VIHRRTLLAGAAAVGAGSLVQASRQAARAQEPPIHPRADWGADLAPTGPLEVEAPGDVRFLLVHHSAGPNDYAPGDVVGLLRGIYDFHTGSKGWPDVAYNFFVDRFGGIWEGRTGSIGAPVKGDATGGSQGFSQLCCLLGTFTDAPPTTEARGALVALLARLAGTYSIDTTPGATTTFVSRGSNRWPAGATVTATTIAGHRDMSQTACPGDALYVSVADRSLAAEATALRAPATTTTTTAPPTTTTVPTTTSTVAATETTSTTAAVTTTLAAAAPTTAVAPTEETQRSGPALLAAVGAALVVAGAIALRRRHAS
jgi:N-acetylmuramoyl-L-alanine amidase-like protein